MWILPITLINNFSSTFPRNDWNYATTYEIDKIIRSLKTKNSYGYDEIPTRILKLSAPFIIFPLTYVCNNPFPEVYSMKNYSMLKSNLSIRKGTYFSPQMIGQSLF